MTDRLVVIFAIVFGAAVLLVEPAQAQSGRDAAAEMARQSTGGRVLSVKPSNDPNRPGYLVKVLLADGRVRTVYINPAK